MQKFVAFLGEYILDAFCLLLVHAFSFLKINIELNEIATNKFQQNFLSIHTVSNTYYDLVKNVKKNIKNRFVESTNTIKMYYT